MFKYRHGNMSDDGSICTCLDRGASEFERGCFLEIVNDVGEEDECKLLIVAYSIELTVVVIEPTPHPHREQCQAPDRPQAPPQYRQGRPGMSAIP